MVVYCRCLQLEALRRQIDAGTKLVLVCVLVDAWHELFVVIFAAEVVFDNFKCLSVDFFVVMTLKKFNFV